MSDLHLLDLLSGADEYPISAPVPDQIRSRAEALREIELRFSAPTKPLEHNGVQRVNPQRGLLIAAAVFAAVVIAGGAFLALTQSWQSEPVSTTTTIPLVGAENDPAARSAFLPVEAAYAAHAISDHEAWFQALFPPDLRQSSTWWADAYATYALANDRFDSVQCTSHGFGDWPGISAEEPFFEDDEIATGFRFECILNETNAFHNAADITVAQVHDWVVKDGSIVAGVVGGDFETPDSFNQDFRNWLFNNHYDVFTRYETLPWLFPSGSSLGTALEYVNQFVEESPTWPRQPGE